VLGAEVMLNSLITGLNKPWGGEFVKWEDRRTELRGDGVER
jgi:hypothetical protein